MTIDATSTITSAAASADAASPGLKGTQDEFLKLFMAQLQHQDPFAPTSGADMVAQLAQLSSVEQAKQTNTQLAELTAAQASAASSGLASLVGRDCTAATGAFQLDGGGAPPPLDLATTAGTKGAALVVTDASGREVRRIAIPDGTKQTSLQWDGKDASGTPLADGSYEISVDPGTSTAAITTTWHGSVDAVELTADGARLRFGGVLVAPASIRTIGASAAPLATPLTLTRGVSE